MAKTTLSKTAAPGPFAAAGVTLTLAAADPSNDNQWVCGAQDFVVVQNTDTASHTLTISSSGDAWGRKGDIAADSIAAGAIRIYGPLQPQGWAQSDGFVYCSADSADVKIGVISLR